MSILENRWSSTWSMDQMSYGRLGALEYYVSETQDGWQISRDVVTRNIKGYQPVVTRELVMNVDRNLVSSVLEVKSMVEVLYAMAGYND